MKFALRVEKSVLQGVENKGKNMAKMKVQGGWAQKPHFNDE